MENQPNILILTLGNSFCFIDRKSCILYVSDSIGEKAYTCQKCSISRDEEEVKKMTREIVLLSDKASSLLSSGSILVLLSMIKCPWNKKKKSSAAKWLSPLFIPSNKLTLIRENRYHWSRFYLQDNWAARAEAVPCFLNHFTAHTWNTAEGIFLPLVGAQTELYLTL